VAEIGQRLTRMLDWVRRAIAHRHAPLVALVVILACSLAARVFDLEAPCSQPCRGADAHTLVFDESYYVNAARVIVGIHPPAGSPYHEAPLGYDANAEHPQLAKIVMAAGIELFGDGPAGWRLGSVLFGLVAIAALYALVLAAGGGGWLAAGAAGVMALDNLLLVHGRIGTLDIYAVALMLLAAVFYMRRRPVFAGLVLGVAACTKIVALYLIAAFVLMELGWTLRARAGERAEGAEAWWRKPVLGLALLVGATVVSLLTVLWLLDLTVPPWDPSTHRTFTDPFSQLAHMLSTGLGLKAAGAPGISSPPLRWLLDQRPIDYARVAVNTLVNGRIVASHAVVDFRGEINPFIIFLALPALGAAIVAAWREADRVAAIGAAWCVGTFLPFLVASALANRVTYLFYMVIVMPGIYLVTARLFSGRQLSRAAALGWAIALVYGFVHLYPLRTFSGH